MIKGKYLVRYATAEDVKAFYEDSPLPQSARIMVLECEGRIVGLAGVTCERNKMVAFSEMKEDIPPKIIIWAAKQFIPLLQKLPVAVIAVASEKHPNSRRFLEYLGFEYVEKQPAGDIFIWQTR